jgi:hypothetical protein
MVLKQVHQVVDFALRTTPVVRGKGVERQRGDPQRRRGFDRPSDRGSAGDMALLPGPTAQERPAAVAIHIDRDMESVSAFAGSLGAGNWLRWFGIAPSRIPATSCHKASPFCETRDLRP